MPSLLVFSSTDIGRNYRLLRHAKSFSNLDNSHVTILAPEISSLPKEIEKSPNIDISYLYVWHFPFFFDFLVYPIQYLIIQYQCFFFYYRSKIKYDFVTSSQWPLFNPIFSFILSRLFKSQLIYDISLFQFTDPKRPRMLCNMERRLARAAKFTICSTRASQVVLQILKIPSTIVHDPPGNQFQVCNVRKQEVFSFLNVKSSFLVGVLMPTYDAQYVETVFDCCSKIDSEGVRITFVIFGNPKIQEKVESIIENSDNSYGQNHGKLTLNNIAVRFVPLNTDAYANTLGCCDFGILLNGSRFGFDFSPELTELVACGVPTAVGKGGCMTEIIHNGQNGFIFESTKQLYEVMLDVFVRKKFDLAAMKESMRKQTACWDDEWKRFFIPLIDNLKVKKD